jgi:uncharacterized protein YkuJ
MIKLTDIAEELKKPKDVYAPGKGPSEEPVSDFIKKGFELGKPEINPETGTVAHDVKYLPDLLKAYRALRTVRQEEIKPFVGYKGNDEIDVLSTNIYEAINRVMKAVNKLNVMVEREKKLTASRNYK